MRRRLHRIGRQTCNRHSRIVSLLPPVGLYGLGLTNIVTHRRLTRAFLYWGVDRRGVLDTARCAAARSIIHPKRSLPTAHALSGSLVPCSCSMRLSLPALRSPFISERNNSGSPNLYSVFTSETRAQHLHRRFLLPLTDGTEPLCR